MALCVTLAAWRVTQTARRHMVVCGDKVATLDRSEEQRAGAAASADFQKKTSAEHALARLPLPPALPSHPSPLLSSPLL